MAELPLKSKPRLSLPKTIGWLLLLLLVVGVLAFTRQVYDFYSGIRSGDIDPIFDRTFGSSVSNRAVSPNVSKSDLLRLQSDDAPSVGSKEAPVVIVEFLDYGCPFCKQSFEHVRQLVTDKPDEVRLIVRDFPIEYLHPGATKAAMAARCVQQIDKDKFWSYHDKLFLNQLFSDKDLIRYAQEAGVAPLLFEECLTSGRTRTAVETDIALGLQSGVQGTPTFFLNGHRVQGSLDREAFDAIIKWLEKQNELSKTKL
ncbi:MAG: DsbA family protein [Candidatus Magasanikbacteria bacterium]|nr:DsbA family protein [Candidatus Magasanikbacteria bacterium]